MKLTKEELANRIQAIGSKENIEDVRTELTSLQEDLESDYSDHEAVIAERDSYIEKNKKLKEDNMDLYLKVTAREKDVRKDDNTETKREFKDLFNEKGGLK